MCSGYGTDGCIRKCGGFILAYLVTGFSGIFHAHFAVPVMSLTPRPYKTFKQESIKKEGAAPNNKSTIRHRKRNRTQMQGSTQSNASVVECQQESMILLWIKNPIDTI